MRAPLDRYRVLLHCGTILEALSLLRGCARNWEKKVSQNSSTVQFDETPTQTHTQPQNSIPFFSLVLQWFVVLILLVLANALWMRYRKTRRRIHRISSIRDAQRTPTTYVDDANR